MLSFRLSFGLKVYFFNGGERDGGPLEAPRARGTFNALIRAPSASNPDDPRALGAFRGDQSPRCVGGKKIKC
jgi:hypothetical protein